MPVDLAQFARPSTTAAPPEPGKVDLAQFASTAPGEEPPDQPSIGGEFQRGLKSGANQLAASLFGLADLAATALGSDTISAAARKGVAESQRNASLLAPSVPDFSDIENGGDFFHWAAAALGQNVPSLATMFAGGGIGSAVARGALRSAVKRGVMMAAEEEMKRTGLKISEKEISKALRNALTKDGIHEQMHAATVRGAAQGAFVPSFAMQSGDLQNEFTAAGIEAPGTALAGGAAAAVLDAAPEALLISRLFPGVERELAKGFVTDVARTMGIQGALEGSTEAAQEAIMLAARAFHDPSFDITAKPNRQRVLEAAAAGALVGAVTGGAGQLAANVTQAPKQAIPRTVRTIPGNMARFVREFSQRVREAQPAPEAAPATEEEAASIIPPISELREAAASVLEEHLTPALNRARERMASAVDAARGALGGAFDTSGTNRIAERADETIRARVKPELDRAVDLIQQEVRNVEARARDFVGEERAKFISDRIDQLKQRVADFVQQRINPVVDQAEQSAASAVETADFGDETPVFGEEDAARMNPREMTRLVFGKPTEITKGEEKVQVRSRGERAIPFDTEEEATQAMNELLGSFPGTSPDALEVQKKDNGFVVAILDVGQAEELFTQQRMIDGLSKARLESRARNQTKPENARRTIRVRRPGQTGFTRMDLPTLAFAGMDLNEREDIRTAQRSEDKNAQLVDGLTTMLGRLIDQGYEIEGGINGLRTKELFPGRRVGDAMRAASKISRARRSTPPVEETPEIGAEFTPTVRDDTYVPPKRDNQGNLRGGNASSPTRATPVSERAALVGVKPIEGEASSADEAADVFRGSSTPENRGVDDPESRPLGIKDTEEAQNRASRTAPASKPIHPAGRPWYASNHRVYVSMGAVDRSAHTRIGQFVKDVTELVGLRNRVLVVDRAGAEQLMADGHPLEEHLTQAIRDNKPGRIIMSGDDAIIYLSENVLVDTRDGDEERAALNTFAVLGHELGHLVEAVHYRALPDELKAQIKAAHESSGSTKDFEEWMADQFVGWASRSSKARNAVEQFFKDVAATIRKIFDLVRGKYGVDETFDKFMRGVVDANEGRVTNEFAAHFENEGIVGRSWFKMPEVKNADVVDLSARRRAREPRALMDKLLAIIDEFQAAKAEQARVLNDAQAHGNRFAERRAGEAVAAFDDKADDIVRRGKDAWEELMGAIDRREGGPDITRVINDALEKYGATPDEVRDMVEWTNDVEYWGMTEDEADAHAAEIRAKFERALEKKAEEPPPQSLDFGDGLPFKDHVSKRTLVRIRRKMRQYPNFVRGAEQTWRAVRWLHDNLTSTLDGSLRRMNLAAATELADKFNVAPGATDKGPTYFRELRRNRAAFMKRVHDVIDVLPEAERAAVLAELKRLNGRDGDYERQGSAALRSVLDDFYDYLVKKGLPVAKVPNYFHRVYDPEKVKANRDAIVAKLVELGVPEQTADYVADNISRTDDDAEFERVEIPSEGFRLARFKPLQDPFFDQFLSDDLERTLERYVNSGVKRAEYNAVLGDDARTSDKWSPTRTRDELFERAKAEGATQRQLDFMNKAIDAMLGRHGRETPAEARRVMAWIATYQNLRLAPLAVLSSFSDAVGPAIRAADTRLAFDALRENIREILNQDSNLWEMGRTFGTISDALNQHILTQEYDNHWFPPLARKVNDKFFRWTGLERWTNMTRAYSLAVGREFVKTRMEAALNGDARAKQELAELGLTTADVQQWILGGEQVYGAPGVSDEASEKVAQALVQFVDESIMNPDPSQRPLWMSSPAFLLLSQFKQFAYAFHNTVGRRLVRNFEQAGTPWQKAYVVMVPALMILALTAFGLELRQQLQYRVWGRKARTDHMSGLEYAWELIERSGLMGASQFAIDWESADERGDTPLMAISGPTLQQLGQWVSDPASQNIPKAIPGFASLPAARDVLRAITPGL